MHVIGSPDVRMSSSSGWRSFWRNAPSKIMAVRLHRLHRLHLLRRRRRLLRASCCFLKPHPLQLLLQKIRHRKWHRRTDHVWILLRCQVDVPRLAPVRTRNPSFACLFCCCFPGVCFTSASSHPGRTLFSIVQSTRAKGRNMYRWRFWSPVTKFVSPRMSMIEMCTHQKVSHWYSGCVGCGGKFFGELKDELAEVVGCFNTRAQQLLQLHLASGLRKYVLRVKYSLARDSIAMIQEGQTLVKYASMNAIAVRKILKKYDKVCMCSSLTAFGQFRDYRSLCPSLKKKLLHMDLTGLVWLAGASFQWRFGLQGAFTGHEEWAHAVTMAHWACSSPHKPC